LKELRKKCNVDLNRSERISEENKISAASAIE
jgi:hypothetical protein